MELFAVPKSIGTEPNRFSVPSLIGGRALHRRWNSLRSGLSLHRCHSLALDFPHWPPCHASRQARSLSNASVPPSLARRKVTGLVGHIYETRCDRPPSRLRDLFLMQPHCSVRLIRCPCNRSAHLAFGWRIELPCRSIKVRRGDCCSCHSPKDINRPMYCRSLAKHSYKPSYLLLSPV